MFDYPLSRKLLCILVIVLTPKSIDKVVNMQLNKVSILADRTSPALSAIQDALTLKDLEFELNQKNGFTPSDDEVEKVNLKGMKISLKEVQGNIPVQQLALRGEAIDVRHFSNKFISINKKRYSGTVVTVSTPDKKSGVISNEPVSLKGLTLASADELILKEKVLPGGIVVRVENNDQDKASRSKVNEKQLASAESVVSSVPTQALVAQTPVKLGGSLRLNGGSFTRSSSFVYHIERKHQGKTYEALSLRGDQRNYEIELIDKKGFLAVELRSPAGEILAYGEENLPQDGSRLLNLTLEPSAGLFSGQSIEEAEVFASENSPIEVSMANTKTFVSGVDGSLRSDEEGFFGETNMFTKNSDFLSSTSKKDYWPTLSLTEAGKAHYPRLVKRSVIERLEGDLDPFGEAVRIESLLLGKVTNKGINRSGVRVEIHGQAYQRPIYFSSEGKPDPSLERTTTHGGFVFANLPDGGYLVQVVHNQELLSQKWFVVRSGHISRGQIDLRVKPEKLIFLESFPAHAKEDREINVREFGLENTIEVNALTAELSGFELEAKTTPSVSVLEVSEASQRGLRQLTIMSSKASDITLKRVNKSWLDTYLNRQRSNRNPELGLIIGFIETSNFTLVTDATDALTEKTDVLYFDKNGNPVSSGVQGGGFILTNTKLGFQPLVIKIENEERFLNKVVYTSSRSISVL